MWMDKNFNLCVNRILTFWVICLRNKHVNCIYITSYISNKQEIDITFV